jgi:hypothetical protein
LPPVACRTAAPSAWTTSRGCRWLRQLTARTATDGTLAGHGIRNGQAMIATLRHRLIRVPARLVRHAKALTLRLPPGYHLLEEVLTRVRALPARS